MTTLRRQVRRESNVAIFSGGKQRPVIVILEPPGTLLGLRLKGERRTYSLPLAWCYQEAIKRTVALERRERKQRREPRGRRRPLERGGKS